MHEFQELPGQNMRRYCFKRITCPEFLSLPGPVYLMVTGRQQEPAARAARLAARLITLRAARAWLFFQHG
jgi:hypothetical protein